MVGDGALMDAGDAIGHTTGISQFFDELLDALRALGYLETGMIWFIDRSPMTRASI